jgi:prepilin-type N-terminal cleavage/methylation domain-containing protein
MLLACSHGPFEPCAAEAFAVSSWPGHAACVGSQRLNASTPMPAPTSRRTMPGRLPIARLSRGFTLLELLAVMVIIGLPAGYVGPKLFA